jgi:hypothetical protein
MAPKRTKPEAQAPAKPTTKRQVTVPPPSEENRDSKPVGIPRIKAMTQPAPAAKVNATRNPARKIAATNGERPVATVRAELSTEMIAQRAYFIGLRRQESGQAGDSTADWLEAERQLRSEAAE